MTSLQYKILDIFIFKRLSRFNVPTHPRNIHCVLYNQRIIVIYSQQMRSVSIKQTFDSLKIHHAAIYILLQTCDVIKSMSRVRFVFSSISKLICFIRNILGTRHWYFRVKMAYLVKTQTYIINTYIIL